MVTHLMNFCAFYSILFDSAGTSWSYRIQDSNLTDRTNDRNSTNGINKEEKRREEKRREEKRREEKRREEKRREEK